MEAKKPNQPKKAPKKAPKKTQSKPQPVETVPVKIDVNPESLISQAIRQKLPVEQMEKILAMRTELKKEWAKEQFFLSLADFQRKCPIIKKTKKVLNKDKTLRYKYAPLDEIIKQTRDLIYQYGFSYVISTTQSDDMVSAKCILHHVSGHSEHTSLAVPIDKTAFMTESQKVASALTFAKRYALCDALGILTQDTDDNTQFTEPELKRKAIKQPEKLTIENICNKIHEFGIAQCNGEEKYFSEWLLSITKTNNIPESEKIYEMNIANIMKLWKILKKEINEFEKATTK